MNTEQKEAAENCAQAVDGLAKACRELGRQMALVMLDDRNEFLQLCRGINALRQSISRPEFKRHPKRRALRK